MDAADPFAAIGRQVLAPLLAAWAEAAAARLRDDPALAPLALMRDGAILGRAVGRRLGRPVANAWLGRRHTAIAAVAHAGDHDNLLNLLVRMRHRPARWDEAAAELSLPSPPAALASRPLDDALLPRFWDWLAHSAVATALEGRTRAARQAVLAHLDALPLPADCPLLLLDVGYAATVQRCLKRVLALSERQRPVHGLYLLTSPGARWAMAGDGRVDGVLANLGAPQPFAATLLRHRDVLECLLATQKGELAGYGPQGEALSSPSPLSASQIAEAALVQAAALEHMGVCSGGVEAARAALSRLLLEPSAAEAHALGGWVHADATALDGVRRLDDGPPDGERDVTLWPAAARLRTGMPVRGRG